MDVIVWPLAALVFGVCGLFIFRAEIRKVIPRVKKAWGVDIETARHDQQELAARKANTAGQLAHPFESISMRENEAAIRADLARRGLNDAQAQIDTLVTHLAAAQLIFSFEMISLTIWGSQIDLLLFINTQMTGAPIESLRIYYDNAAAQAPDHLEKYSFDRYVGFLRDQGLLRDAGDRLNITNFGKEFLAHLARSGATFRRPY